MANAGECNKEVFENGETVAIMAGKGALEIESYVKSISEKTGQRMDWHYSGGRAVVKVLGDVDIVRTAITENQDERFQFLIY